MSLTWRKELVTVCQYGYPIGDVQDMWDSVQGLLISEPLELNGRYYTIRDLELLSEVIVVSRVTRSLVWMFLRTAPELGPVQSPEIALQGFLKELKASQERWSPSALFSYSDLFGFERNPNITTPKWAWVAEYFGRQLIQAFRRVQILWPTVNRKKNVSQDTAAIYNLYDASKHPKDVTTLDLEVLCYRTGVRVQGISEMRANWKFNDLKPRDYYAAGGDQYWTSRYMKRIAVIMMNCLPETHILRRMDPTTQLNLALDPEKFFVYWDMKSFTTNLSELKYFLYWVSRFLEQHCPPDIFLRCFDYRDGLFTMTPWDLLDTYNAVCNAWPEFSVHRLIHLTGEIGDIDPVTTRLLQHNNGMLGVHGNIGLSTLCHGYHISRVTEQNASGVSIGDDALASSRRDPEELIIPTMQRLGEPLSTVRRPASRIGVRIQAQQGWCFICRLPRCRRKIKPLSGCDSSTNVLGLPGSRDWPQAPEAALRYGPELTLTRRCWPLCGNVRRRGRHPSTCQRQ
jgi:hypothetical protein